MLIQFCNLTAKAHKIMEKVFSGDWLGRPLTITTGHVALQADAAVWVQYGETVVQATVVQSKTRTQVNDQWEKLLKP